MPIRIERAKPNDAPDLVKTQIAAFHYDAVMYPGIEPDGPPGYQSVEVMQRKISNDEAYKFIDEASNQIIGGMVIYVGEAAETGEYHLDVIFIDPTFHNRGIGSQAMRFLETQYPNARLWTLNTPVYATRNHHFYEKLGYVRIGDQIFYPPDDIALYTYEKHITATD